MEEVWVYLWMAGEKVHLALFGIHYAPVLLLNVIVHF